MAQFHAKDGSGYAFWHDVLAEIDTFNPQVAARLARSMDQWKRYIPSLRIHAEKTLKKIASRSLSRDTREIITKSLGQ